MNPSSYEKIPFAMQRGVDKNGWRILGPGGGGAQYIPTIKPDDPNTALVACDMTGSYLTRDGGKTWKQLNFKVWAGAFAFDPNQPETIYVGFDEVKAVVERFDTVYGSVGTHPHNAHEELDIPVCEIVRLSRHPKIVSIGEAGLDCFYKDSTPAAQAEGFRNHIAAARETGLPLEIHTRDADADTLAILKAEHARGPFPASLHCFTGGRELAMGAVDLGLYVSFSGVISFKKSESLREIARSGPAVLYGGSLGTALVDTVVQPIDLQAFVITAELRT